ncbi:hypothetical protein [Kitasatospora sp. NPDC127060]|uniref:hypothetical protein n=1 Tax=Kitasatospora sp. NPDC127060 TaxID=3347121 RepID=UPI00365F9061
MPTFRDPWPWSNREAEYRRLFPAALETVAEILDVARHGAGAQLREAEVEPVPEPWPVGEDPHPQSPAGKLMAVWNSLPPTCISLPNPEARDAQYLAGLLNAAVHQASEGEWYDASEQLKEVLRVSWKITGYRYLG